VLLDTHLPVSTIEHKFSELRLDFLNSNKRDKARVRNFGLTTASVNVNDIVLIVLIENVMSRINKVGNHVISKS
jgi:hypothetical protein